MLWEGWKRARRESKEKWRAAVMVGQQTITVKRETFGTTRREIGDMKCCAPLIALMAFLYLSARVKHFGTG